GEDELKVRHVSVEELRARLAGGERFGFIDVREPLQWDICRLEKSELIPMAKLPARMSEFDSAEDVILICKNGARSAHAVKMFHEAGFTRVWNVAGGLLEWSDRIVTKLPKY